ncbi:MAG: serine/threonine protein kinase [Thermoanaerobaculia bacterium]|nr:serine/threonine protein kinase [Thermoanaerobaculia bacterium]MBP9826184.1 serine/threonine protein kinase [Thermoanaerobaculia bacterium]
MTQPGDESDLFLSLTPERVLDAVEAAGVAVRPLCYPLNSFENRVYEVELADRSRVVAKFYRPQRWTAGAILEEHRFLAELDAEEIPVCPARPFPDGSTLATTAGGIFYTLFDRKGGRAPAELDSRGASRLGMLVGRLHVVGARRPEADRLPLTSEAYVRRDLDWLERAAIVPRRLAARYFAAGRAIADAYDRMSAGVAVLRLHGDLHLGNVLDRDGELRLLDFDDCMIGPAVQDLWLALGGRDTATTTLREEFLESYEQFRRFDRAELRLIEPLRGLRMAHYAAWLARRWHDPIFPRNWPHFGTEESWERETVDLEEQRIVVDRVERGGSIAPPPTAEDEEALTNKDLFWDWNG